MTDIVLSYLAGIIDADGSIGVKKSTYAMRVTKDATQPIYSERISVKQVEPHAVELLKKTFGGYRGIDDPSCKRGRRLHCWHVHSAVAGRALNQLIPFLRIKRRQAENAIKIRNLVSVPRRWPVPPIAPDEAMVTATEFAELAGIARTTILQAAWHKSIPSVKRGRNRMIPLSFLGPYKARHSDNGGSPRRSQATTDAMEACYQRAKELNKVGV